MTSPAPNGTAKWQLWATVAGLAVVVLGAMMTLYVQVNTAYTTAQELQARVDRISASMAASQGQITQLCASMVEIETQFRASDQVRNLMHIGDLRVQSLLWQKAFGREYPVVAPYLPSIAQEQPAPCK